ncbi:MAG: hypothetical protein ACQEW5_22970 [Bacillota bacterium]
MSEINKQVEESRERSKNFEDGHNYGVAFTKGEIKRNKMLETLLLEFIGYEDEWLTRKSGYKKYNKDDLIDIIFVQRSLMKTLYENVEHSKKEELKIKIEKPLWPIMHQD